MFTRLLIVAPPVARSMNNKFLTLAFGKGEPKISFLSFLQQTPKEPIFGRIFHGNRCRSRGTRRRRLPVPGINAENLSRERPKDSIEDQPIDIRASSGCRHASTPRPHNKGLRIMQRLGEIPLWTDARTRDGVRDKEVVSEHEEIQPELRWYALGVMDTLPCIDGQVLDMAEERCTDEAGDVE